MRIVETNDGSKTFFEPNLQETYHSQSGAIEESQEKFVRPAKLIDGHHILDICFGLGFNSLMAALTNKTVHIDAIEIDSNLLQSLTSDLAPQYREEYEHLISQIHKANNPIKILNTTINLHICSFITKLPNLPDQTYDRIFFDPFSPKKCPEQWSKDIFEQCHRVLKPNGYLLTYSCARIVRENLTAAGFTCVDGPAVGRKSPSTIAHKYE
ncbi:MAG: tRNA (5-methylaminomethyl-2-thiouridine)(34)-methyltransferase MnmD [Candidatus Woesearchaeota archaeon]